MQNRELVAALLGGPACSMNDRFNTKLGAFCRREEAEKGRQKSRCQAAAAIQVESWALQSILLWPRMFVNTAHLDSCNATRHRNRQTAVRAVESSKPHGWSQPWVLWTAHMPHSCRVIGVSC